MSTPDDEYAALEAEMSQPAEDLAHLGLEVSDPIAPSHEHPAAETYNPNQHGQPQQQQQQQPQQPQYGGPPDVESDPIGHFSARQNAVENHLGEKQFWGNVEASENRFRNELAEGEYDEATELLKQQRMAELTHQFPDTHQTAALAYRHGLQSPAQLRAAILRNDAITVAQHAIANGQDPARAYYELAVQRGHKPKTVMLKSYSRAVTNNIDKFSDKDFDQFWAAYTKASKQVEGS